MLLNAGLKIVSLLFPTPFSAGLFLTQNIYGAWFTAEPPPHCTRQDESNQRKRSRSTTEPLCTACSHPACCMEAEDLGRIWQHMELSTGGRNGVFLWLMATPVGEGQSSDTPATHGYRADIGSNPSLEVRERHSGVGSLISNAQPRRGALGAAHPPAHTQTPSTPTPAPAAFAPATPGLTDAGLQSMERSTGQRFGSVYL